MRKTMTLVMLTVFALGIMTASALAEGYNNGHYNYTSETDKAGYADNAGIYVREPVSPEQIAASGAAGSWRGPHGGYSVSTNKCQDCHSTHYATGSYMLLRSDSREEACDFCHGGGGGSTTNIMMDQPATGNGSYADVGGTSNLNNIAAMNDEQRGMGTGHTLGYGGSAPAGINPAWSDDDGLACFDCHSPHGNSARVLSTPAAPGAAIDVFPASWGAEPPGNGVVETVLLNHGNAKTLLPTSVVYNYAGASMTVPSVETSTGILDKLRIDMPGSPIDGMYDLNKATQAEWDVICMSAAAPFQKTARWGISPFARNMVFRRASSNPLAYNPDIPGTKTADVSAITRPIFEQGKWLLLKNPNNTVAEETITVYDWRITNADGYIKLGVGGVPLASDAHRGAVRTIKPGEAIPDTVVGFRFNDSDGFVAENVDSATWETTAGVPGATVSSINTPAAPNRDPNRIYLKGEFTVAEINANGPAVQAAWVSQYDDGVSKYAIDWENSLGPEDSSGLPEQEDDRSQPYPFTPSPAMKPGFGSQNEFCADCHDGAAGASTQKANVYLDTNQKDFAAGDYALVYSHDSQPRH